MIRIFVFVILAAIALTIAYFLTKSSGRKKGMLVLGSGVLAAAAGIFMQAAFPMYLSLLGIVAISLIASLLYMKMLEREEQKKQLMLEERRAEKNKAGSRPAEPAKKPVQVQAAAKPFGMQTITAVREEQKVGQ
jgi:membrane protein implicated in regulation of membrane protease activity